MATTKDDIRGWIERGKEQGASHVIVMCDTWDYTDYPAFAMPGDDPRDVAKKAGGELARPLECYDLSMDIEAQLDARRAQNWTPWPRPTPDTAG